MFRQVSVSPPAAPEKPLIENLEVKKEDEHTPDIITKSSVQNCSASRRLCKHQEKRERMERKSGERMKKEEENLSPQEEGRQAEHTGEGEG